MWPMTPRADVEDSLDEERLVVFRELLQSRLDALLANAGSHIGSLVEKREQLADHTDVASEESNREFTLRLAEHERSTIKAIRAAMARMNEGEYGFCVACGEEIGERRLMARPMTTQCIDCKTEAEMRSGRRMR
jgi:DnaK suppressor protein